MVLGRPPEFDPEQALEEAMDVFWKHGCEHTSLQDLLAARWSGPGKMAEAATAEIALIVGGSKHEGSRHISGDWTSHEAAEDVLRLAS